MTTRHRELILEALERAPSRGYDAVARLAARIGVPVDEVRRPIYDLITGELVEVERHRGKVHNKTITRIALTDRGRACAAELADMRRKQNAELTSDWRDYANCRGLGTDYMFPGRGDDVAACKAVCAGCIVKDDCLEYALDAGEKYGIWGGLSEQERRLLRRQRRLGPDAPIPHGTSSGYNNHGCYCADCREAANAAKRRGKATA